MKRRMSVVLLTLLSINGCSSRSQAQQSDAPSNKPLVVHEWGTFTTFAGSDGVHLEFRPFAAAESDLPYFVADRSNAHGNPFTKRSFRSLVRMETPVTYFYTDQEMDVNVRVDFPKGLLTEFYPPVRSMRPAFDRSAANHQGELIGNSMLDWGRVHLIPKSKILPAIDNPALNKLASLRFEQTLYQPADNYPHYQFARETDSAIVQWKSEATDTTAEQGGLYGVDHFEKFLFYRGIGNFQMPIDVKQTEEGRVFIGNDSELEIRSAFYVEFKNGTLKMAHLPTIPAKSTSQFPEPQSINIGRLSASVQQALVGEGLYEKEAMAMVNCWNNSWFLENGCRVFYMVPQSITNQLIPLRIEPSPTETIRVLVARSEILSVDTEKKVTEDVLRHAETRATRDKAISENPQVNVQPLRFPDSILQMGRLAEPMLQRVAQVSEDPKIDREVEQLIVELEQLQGSKTDSQ